MQLTVYREEFTQTEFVPKKSLKTKLVSLNKNTAKLSRYD